MNTASDTPLVLITGGGRGVGAATARLAAAQGYDVAISFVSNEAAALAVAADVEAAGRRALPFRADGADPKQISQLFEAIDRDFGRIDVLVNNAAIIAPQSRLEDFGFERIQHLFAVNAIGPISSRNKPLGECPADTAEMAARSLISHRRRPGLEVQMSISTMLLQRAPLKHSRLASPKRSRGREFGSIAFAPGTSTPRCMPAAENPDE